MCSFLLRLILRRLYSAVSAPLGRVHTDMDAGKVATMQIYLVSDTVAIWDYGTCLHTQQQYERRRIFPDGPVRAASIPSYVFPSSPSTSL